MYKFKILYEKKYNSIENFIEYEEVYGTKQL